MVCACAIGIVGGVAMFVVDRVRSLLIRDEGSCSGGGLGILFVFAGRLMCWLSGWSHVG